MANISETKVNTPIIIIGGDYGVGKSYINQLIKKYVNSTVSVNSYDLITRSILFICSIHPTQIGYKFISSDEVDRSLYALNNKLNYLKDEISQYRLISEKDVKYYINTALSLDIILSDDVVKNIVNKINILIKDSSNKTTDKSIVLKDVYNLTTYLFSSLKEAYKLEDFTTYYMSILFPPLEHIQENWLYRIIYYVDTPEEITYLQNNYNTISFFVDMSHKLQSQLLLKTKQYDKVDEIITDRRKDQISKIKSICDFIVNNELEMKNKLINKIMSQINI